MHTWLKTKIAMFILVSMVLTSCQDPPPPPQVVKPKPLVVTVKIEEPPLPAVKQSPVTEIGPSSTKPSPTDKPSVPNPEVVTPAVLPPKTEIQLQHKPVSEVKSESNKNEEPGEEDLLPGTATIEPYSSLGKIDPFMPLISTEPEKPVQENAGEEKPARVLTPLEKFDLSQIRLVAIVLAESGTIAMVEEASGKGYEVRVGTYLGKDGGKVEEILEDRLVIKEIVKDFRGKTVTRTKEMKLHKQEIEG